MLYPRRSVISRDRFCFSFTKTLWSIKRRPKFERTFISTLRKTRYRSNSRLISHVSAKSRNRQSRVLEFDDRATEFYAVDVDRCVDDHSMNSWLPINWRVWDLSKTTMHGTEKHHITRNFVFVCLKKTRMQRHVHTSCVIQDSLYLKWYLWRI